MINYQLKYQRLEDLVKMYLASQDRYLVDRDHDKLKTVKAIGTKLRDFVNKKEEKTLFDINQ